MTEIVTRKGKALGAPKRWAQRYAGYQGSGSDEKQRITEKLNGLTLEERTPERIDQIIGNDTWTRVSCDLCDDSVERAAALSDGINDLLVCESCLRAAEIALFSERKNPS
ncbi:hypothetical protein [Ruegeria jejuensis]|uniref:hypothetical protein n=1 Tax=Ruegeria jejuensis TaxID=3233338 RepID=UPI00355BA53D